MQEEPPSRKQKNFFDRIAAAFHDEEVMDAASLVRCLKSASANGVVGSDTLSMMEGALKVADLRVHDLMIPRSQIFAINLLESKEEWIRMVMESGHSRFPAMEGNLDNIAGIMHAKDLLKLVLDPSLDARSFVRPARFIPESQPINVLLRDFKESRSHMALVIDEFGSVSGLITIEDCLEQIVGDISDEFDHDDADASIVEEAEGKWRVKALTLIDDFNEYFDSELEDDYCETIGGLVTDRFEHVPVVGEEIIEKGFKFTISRADKRQVKQLVVEKIDVDA